MARDAAGRAVSGTATVDGVEQVPVFFSYNTRISAGDTWLVENAGAAAAPRWTAKELVSPAVVVPSDDPTISLPTPTGLQVVSTVGPAPPSGTATAELYIWWVGIGTQYGAMQYEVEIRTDQGNIGETNQFVTDPLAVLSVSAAITAGDTVIPRSPAPDRDCPRRGWLRIEIEKASYEGYTYGLGDSGASGTGGVNLFTVAGAGWTPDEWINYCLVDSAGAIFLIIDNDATTLTVTGTPATGYWMIRGCFYGVTRGVGGTAAAAHASGVGAASLSIGLAQLNLVADTDYNVRVRAHSAAGAVSAWTAWVTATTAVDVTPPAVPTGMSHTPMDLSTVRIRWDANTENDLGHYEVDGSTSPGGASAGPFPVPTGQSPYLVVPWGYASTLYWRVRAVDHAGNASDYTAWQTANAQQPSSPGLLNEDFEDGTGSPDNWTLYSAGVVTASWVTDLYNSYNHSIRFQVTAGSGSGYHTALRSDLVEIAQGVIYQIGIHVSTAAPTANVFKLTVFQYADGAGTPAGTPKRQFDLIQQAPASPWEFGYLSYFMINPDDDDVTHVALGIEIGLTATVAQTLNVDDAIIEVYYIPQPVGAVPVHGHTDGSAGGLLDHGVLTNLADDDHTQYLNLTRHDTTARHALGTVVPHDDHGLLSGLADDDHSQYVHLSSPRTITAQHTIAPALAAAPLVLGASAQGQTVIGLKADQLNKAVNVSGLGLSGGGALTEDRSITLASSPTPGAAASILATDADGKLTLAKLSAAEIHSSLTPAVGDAYDLGHSAKFWRHGYISELDALVFAQQTIALVGGWLRIGHDEGTLAYDVSDADDRIDFGKSMTFNDLVELRAIGQVEYVKVLQIVTGTIYSVTRNLDGSGANDWPAGTPFSVLGAAGDGRVELSGYDAPRISILLQGATYDATTEVVRIGDLGGSFGIGSERYGIGLGDYTGGNYLRYEPTDGFVLKAGGGVITLDGDGIGITSEAGADVDPSNGVRFTDPTFGLVGYLTSRTYDGSMQIMDLWNNPDADALDGTLSICSRASGTGKYANAYIGAEHTGNAVGEPTVIGVYQSETLGYAGVHNGYLMVVDDIRLGGGLYVGSTATDPAEDWIYADGGMFINDTANANQTIGLTINQGANTDEIVTLKNSNVAHGMTTLTETDTVCMLKEQSADGGVALWALKGGTMTHSALQMCALVGVAADTTKSAAGRGIAALTLQIKSGAGGTTPGANANLFTIESGGSRLTRFIFDQEGDLHMDAALSANAWDDHDDLALLHGLRAATVPALRERWGEFIEQARPVLEGTGVATFNDDGSVWIGMRGLQMLVIDALRQFAAHTDTRLSRIENRLLEA